MVVLSVESWRALVVHRESVEMVLIMPIAWVHRQLNMSDIVTNNKDSPVCLLGQRKST